MTPLTEVYQNDDFQITGVSVSSAGRLFVNFPRWSDRYLNAVVEVAGEEDTPYPDEYWNRWDGKPENAATQFVCVQSIVASGDSLWVLDPAAPMLGPVVSGGPKLVEIDLTTDTVKGVYLFEPGIAGTTSYLNDVRIDPDTSTAYITDSGNGGIVVLNLHSGKAHRALDGHKSVLADQTIAITVSGKRLAGPDGKPPQFNSDGIALSPESDYLYYQALTGDTLYRIHTSVLRDNPDRAAQAAEEVAKTFPVDGLWMDSASRIYLSGIEDGSVSRLLPDGSIEMLAADPRLQWPDTFTQGPDGDMYVTASHINDMPRFNHGKSTRTMPYSVFRFKPS